MKLAYFKIRNARTGALALNKQGTILYYRFMPAAQKWVAKQDVPNEWYVVPA